jgi:hypothetical protein
LGGAAAEFSGDLAGWVQGSVAVWSVCGQRSVGVLMGRDVKVCEGVLWMLVCLL